MPKRTSTHLYLGLEYSEFELMIMEEELRQELLDDYLAMTS